MATITIGVQSLLNAALYDSYTVSDGITVSTLKSDIQTATGVDVLWFNLVYNDEVLVDANTLVSYSIVDGSSLRSANIIDVLPTLQDRQLAKLDLAQLRRISLNDPYPTYDINLLPSQYIGNVSTPNSHPDGLIQGRPWIIPEPALYLYPADTASYAGSGDTWYDLSGDGNNGTLYNTPIYNQTYFSFDKDSFEWASVPDLGDLSTWSIETWFKITSTLTGQITAVICNEFDLVNKLNFSMGTNNAPGSYNMCIGFFDGAWHNTTGFAPVLDTWYHCVGTYDGTTIKQYVNGALNTQLSYAGTPQSGGDVRIARRWDSADNNSINFFPCDIGLVRIYSDVLTAGQILANYTEYSSVYKN